MCDDTYYIMQMENKSSHTEIVIEDESGPRRTTVHDRYQICDECCGFVASESRKRDAINRMIRHMDSHDPSETLTFSVYDLMGRKDRNNVYGGRIYQRVRSHGVGVAQ